MKKKLLNYLETAQEEFKTLKEKYYKWFQGKKTALNRVPDKKKFQTLLEMKPPEIVFSSVKDREEEKYQNKKDEW